jgi:hypothetical protein
MRTLDLWIARAIRLNLAHCAIADKCTNTDCDVTSTHVAVINGTSLARHSVHTSRHTLCILRGDSSYHEHHAFR